MKNFLSVLIVVISSMSLFSQETKVIQFGETDNEDYNYKQNVIKTSPTAFLFGRIPLEFERELTDFFSIQVGAGATFLSALSGLSSDFYSELIDEGNSNNNTDNSIKKGSLGSILSISPRLWFDSDGIDGAYIAPVFRFSRYKNEIQKIQEGLNDIVRIPNSYDMENSKNFDMAVHYGYQSLNEIITWEYFFGLGIRNQTIVEQEINRINSQYTSSTVERTGKSILVELGLRIGFRL